jgi:hypothetical protein
VTSFALGCLPLAAALRVCREQRFPGEKLLLSTKYSRVTINTKDVPWTSYFKGWATLSNASTTAVKW